MRNKYSRYGSFVCTFLPTYSLLLTYIPGKYIDFLSDTNQHWDYTLQFFSFVLFLGLYFIF